MHKGGIGNSQASHFLLHVAMYDCILRLNEKSNDIKQYLETSRKGDSFHRAKMRKTTAF